MAVSAPTARASETEESPEEFFAKRIKPVLADSCLRCHGPTKQRSGLRLDSREAVLRGGHGPIVVPGNPAKSRLLDALSYQDEDLQMPPDGKLTASQIADFTRWVQLGVPWSPGAPMEQSRPAGDAPPTPAPKPKVPSPDRAERP